MNEYFNKMTMERLAGMGAKATIFFHDCTNEEEAYKTLARFGTPYMHQFNSETWLQVQNEQFTISAFWKED